MVFQLLFVYGSSPTFSSTNVPSRLTTRAVPVCRAISRARRAARNNALGAAYTSASGSLDSSGSLTITALLQHRRDLTTQRRDPILRHVPDELVVHTEVVVYQAVTHPVHGSPVDHVVRHAKRLGNFLCCFADDFKAPNKGSPKGLVRHEGIAIEARRLAQQVVASTRMWRR